jgi:MoxR-like ATPase
VNAVLTGEEILAAQALARDVRVSDELFAYAARLVRATRPEQTQIAFVREWTRWGASPRAGQSLVLAAKARALLHGRLAVTLDDVRRRLPGAVHRLLVNFRAEAECSP